MSDHAHEDEYDDTMVSFLELIYGDGFIAPGGPEEVNNLIKGVDLVGKLVLDIGCGVGGIDVMLARDHGCDIIAVDVEAPLVERARQRAAAAGLAERIDFRVVEPGPIPLKDEAVDIVFSKDVWIHIADKPALLADVFRVLRPGGLLVAADWCRGPEPFSADMDYFFELEGLTYSMATLDSYGVNLGDCGFTGIELTDISSRFRTLSQNQYERLKGPLNEPMRALVGDKMAGHFVENWRQLLVVIDNGELRPGHMRARKPD
jgi:SAM-dependent methyltransferase